MNLSIRSLSASCERTRIFSSGFAAESAAPITPSAKIFRFEAFGRVEKALGNSIDQLAAKWSHEDPNFAEAMAKARSRRADREQAKQGITLKSLRLSKGLSQAELAAKVGMRQPHIARMERGGSCPTFQTCRRIAVALDVDMNTLDRALPSVRDTIEETL